MRGSSGAKIVIEENIAAKSGDRRVGDQGWWISQNASSVLPRVSAVGSDWYHMEILYDIDETMSHHVLLEQVLAALTQLWSRPRVNDIGLVAHVTKIRSLCLDEFTPLARLLFSIDWSRLRTGLTHGDPTLENVMRRANGDIVLIDPIPSTPAVPDYLAVDTGKILQSILGYEAIRYATSTQRWDISPLDLRTIAQLDQAEWTATCYWAAVHVLRAIPYAPRWSHSGLRGLVRDACSLV